MISGNLQIARSYGEALSRGHVTARPLRHFHLRETQALAAAGFANRVKQADEPPGQKP